MSSSGSLQLNARGSRTRPIGVLDESGVRWLRDGTSSKKRGILVLSPHCYWATVVPGSGSPPRGTNPRATAEPTPAAEPSADTIPGTDGNGVRIPDCNGVQTPATDGLRAPDPDSLHGTQRNRLRVPQSATHRRAGEPREDRAAVRARIQECIPAPLDDCAVRVHRSSHTPGSPLLVEVFRHHSLLKALRRNRRARIFTSASLLLSLGCCSGNAAVAVDHGQVTERIIYDQGTLADYEPARPTRTPNGDAAGSTEPHTIADLIDAVEDRGARPLRLNTARFLRCLAGLQKTGEREQSSTKRRGPGTMVMVLGVLSAAAFLSIQVAGHGAQKREILQLNRQHSQLQTELYSLRSTLRSRSGTPMETQAAEHEAAQEGETRATGLLPQVAGVLEELSPAAVVVDKLQADQGEITVVGRTYKVSRLAHIIDDLLSRGRLHEADYVRTGSEAAARFRLLSYIEADS